MRAKVVRQIRKLAYGPDGAPRDRRYYHHPRGPGTIIADDRCQRYQRLKTAYQAGKFTL
jgi:hypothetical protein